MLQHCAPSLSQCGVLLWRKPHKEEKSEVVSRGKHVEHVSTATGARKELNAGTNLCLHRLPGCSKVACGRRGKLCEQGLPQCTHFFQLMWQRRDDGGRKNQQRGSGSHEARSAWRHRHPEAPRVGAPLHPRAAGSSLGALVLRLSAPFPSPAPFAATQAGCPLSIAPRSLGR